MTAAGPPPGTGGLTYLERARARDKGMSAARLAANGEQVAAEVAGDVVGAFDHLEPSVALKAERLRGALLDADGLAALPPPRPLIDGVLPAGGLVVLYGKPGSCKTFVALDWALSVSCGAWWLGREVHAGAALVIAGEGTSGLSARIEAWKADRAIYQLPHARFLPRAVNLLDKEWSAALVELVARGRPALIVVDTLSRAMPGGDENAAKDMTRMIEVTDDLRRRSSATVVLVHHDSRAGGNPRGHSALDGAADTVIYCESDGDTVVLRNEAPAGKQKDAEPFAPIRLSRKPVGASIVLVKATLDSGNLPPAALEMLRTLSEIATAAGVSTTAWETSTDVARRTFYRWRKRLVEDGLSANVGTETSPRYTITEQGESVIND